MGWCTWVVGPLCLFFEGYGSGRCAHKLPWPAYRYLYFPFEAALVGLFSCLLSLATQVTLGL